MKLLLFAVTWLFAFGTSAHAEDKKADGPVKLELIAKSNKYKLDTGGKTPAEYKKMLEEVKLKDFGAPRPRPPAVDLVLKLTNTSKEDVTIYVGGDSNVYTFELTGGDGVVTMSSGLAFTADFRLPKAVTLAPGKSHEIPIMQLSDGSRGASRYVYWTGPGEYKLSATYTLSDQDGGRGPLLKSEPVKITVTDK